MNIWRKIFPKKIKVTDIICCLCKQNMKGFTVFIYDEGKFYHNDCYYQKDADGYDSREEARIYQECKEFHQEHGIL